ncbi:hypothetical protein N7491_000348 [Penicillium cf. griseofulvum]|uniref:Uncharacterized protein n=1 Tax=Penicillium cf. griseofulvum TaxID=2972120 RepID=A0A9W9MER0_9EURO|nr:hypothetical protein N7472_004293 [Penicillium cf. griseofulvum]KAJ5443381.1 hypothetical protein N7445_004494 [Penicillium cf. griseofulvum]KAJ5451166.1 hypothetical protein N7491_000348 [Penicillium cf. griseofulvum]
MAIAADLFSRFCQFDNFINLTFTFDLTNLTIVLQYLQGEAQLTIVDASQMPLQRRGCADW